MNLVLENVVICYLVEDLTEMLQYGNEYFTKYFIYLKLFVCFRKFKIINPS